MSTSPANTSSTVRVGHKHYKYYDVLSEVEPKREALRQAAQKVQEAVRNCSI